MDLIQILDCSAELGNCCSSPTIASVLDITRKIFGLIQVIAPIILIVMATVQVLLLTINPEEKDAFKKIYNKFLAAIIIFILPIILNVIMGLLPNSINISACWNEASNISYSSEGKYVELEEREKLIIEAEKVDAVYKKASSSSGSSGSSSYNNKVVAYAMQFKGKAYKAGSSWNGELPYTGTDCSGFIRGVYKHFGVNLTWSCHGMAADKATTKVDKNNIQAGDIIVYSKWRSYPGHCALATGNGKEIIHASSPKNGVMVSSNYKYRPIDFVLRVNGVK